MTIVFTLKLESVSKNTIFGLKMMVKSGLEKIFLKFLNEGDYFPLLHKSAQNHKFSNKNNHLPPRRDFKIIFSRPLVKGTIYSEDVGKIVTSPFIRTFFCTWAFFPVNGMNSSDKMSIFSFFCINQINLLKLIQIYTHIIMNNFIALQAL